MQLTNGKLTAVKKFKEGDNDKGHWEMWHLTVNGDKFTWFRKEKDPVPAPGMVIAFCEYKEETKGKYTNRTIQKAVKWANGESEGKPTNGASPAKTGNGSSKEDPWWFCLAYAKDLMINHPAVEKMTPREAAAEILTIAETFYARKPGSEKPKSEKKQVSFPDWVKARAPKIPKEAMASMCSHYDVKNLWEITGKENQESAVKDISRVLANEPSFP